MLRCNKKLGYSNLVRNKMIIGLFKIRFLILSVSLPRLNVNVNPSRTMTILLWLPCGFYGAVASMAV